MLRFLDFELDPNTPELRRHGEPVKLSRQPLRALVYLAERPQRLVTRAELQAAIWDAGTHVDFEHGLNTCIRQIRSALGDDASQPLIIETIPKIGFRFKPPVIQEREAEPSTTAATARPRLAWIVLAACLTLAVVALLFGTQYSAAASRRGWPTRSSDAYQLWVRGQVALEQRWTTEGGSALELFTRATELDPGFAAAYAGLADAYWEEAFRGAMPSVRAYERAREAAEHAVQLGPDVPEAHLALARVSGWMGRDPEAAERAYRTALAINPRHHVSLRQYGLWLALQGRFDEALSSLARAKAVNPAVAAGWYAEAVALHYARRFDACLASVAEALARDPALLPAHHTAGQCSQALGRFDEAFAAYARSGRRSGNYGEALARVGRVAEAQEVLAALAQRYDRRPTGSTAMEVAQVHIGLGNRDEALRWLELADGHGAFLAPLAVAPVFDPLRADPRFIDLLARVRAPVLPALSPRVYQNFTR